MIFVLILLTITGIRIRIRITLFEYKLASYERRIALYL